MGPLYRAPLLGLPSSTVLYDLTKGGKSNDIALACPADSD
jgi:hypothetical protein